MPRPGEFWQSAFYSHEIVEVIAIYPEQVYIKSVEKPSSLWKCPLSWFISRYSRVSKLERYLLGLESSNVE